MKKRYWLAIYILSIVILLVSVVCYIITDKPTETEQLRISMSILISSWTACISLMFCVGSNK